MATIECSATVTSDPFNFFNYLKFRNERLYSRVIDLIIFEEIVTNSFELKKLYSEGTWDKKTKIDLDLVWWEYCHVNP